MKKLLLLGIGLILCSCVDQTKRLNRAQVLYPKCVVQPTTSLLSQGGYDVMVEDTISNQIYALRFYPFSETTISDIRNIK